MVWSTPTPRVTKVLHVHHSAEVLAHPRCPELRKPAVSQWGRAHSAPVSVTQGEENRGVGVELEIPP